MRALLDYLTEHLLFAAFLLPTLIVVCAATISLAPAGKPAERVVLTQAGYSLAESEKTAQ